MLKTSGYLLSHWTMLVSLIASPVISLANSIIPSEATLTISKEVIPPRSIKIDRFYNTSAEKFSIAGFAANEDIEISIISARNHEQQYSSVLKSNDSGMIQVFAFLKTGDSIVKACNQRNFCIEEKFEILGWPPMMGLPRILATPKSGEAGTNFVFEMPFHNDNNKFAKFDIKILSSSLRSIAQFEVLPNGHDKSYFILNTSDFAPGSYLIDAYAVPHPGQPAMSYGGEFRIVKEVFTTNKS